MLPAQPQLAVRREHSERSAQIQAQLHSENSELQGIYIMIDASYALAIPANSQLLIQESWSLSEPNTRLVGENSALSRLCAGVLIMMTHVSYAGHARET